MKSSAKQFETVLTLFQALINKCFSTFEAKELLIKAGIDSELAENARLEFELRSRTSSLYDD